MADDFKTYLINLDSDLIRLQSLDRQLKAARIAYHRFPAIRGAELPQNLSEYFFHDAERRSPLSDGEVGCYASHLEIMRLTALSKNVTLVLEDDLLIPDKLGAIVAHCLRLPCPWDIVRLSSMDRGAVWRVGTIDEDFDVVHYQKVPLRTGAYLITPLGAQKFLDWSEMPRRRPIDLDLRRDWQTGLTTLGVYPNPISQNHFPSSIDTVAFRNRPAGKLKYRNESKYGDKLARFLYNRATIGTFPTIFMALGLKRIRRHQSSRGC